VEEGIMIQMHAFYLFVAIASVLAAVFLYVALSTRHPRDVDYHAAYSVRRKLLFVVLAVLALGMGMTLGKTPYPRGSELPDKVVFVVGKQFSFALSDAPITNDQEYEAGTYSTPVQVLTGSLVEFRVTSFDVNHSFAVYSPEDHLIAQTQAMPGYVNRLRVRFQEPGRYYVLCLELCGMGHHRMRGVFDVK
jgi:cytochrome c oxidase subunit II